MSTETRIRNAVLRELDEFDELEIRLAGEVHGAFAAANNRARVV